MSHRRISILLHGVGWTLCVLLALAGWRLAQTRLEAQAAGTEAAAATRAAEIRRLQHATALLRQPAPAPAVEPPVVAFPTGPVEPPRPSSPEVLRSQAVVTLASLVKAQTLKITPGSRITEASTMKEPKTPDPLQPDASGAFPKEFAELFTLSEAEFETMRQEMIALRNRVDADRAEQTTLSRGPDGSLVLTTPALQEGAGFKEEFRQLLLRTLGPANFEAFKAMRSDPSYDHSGGIGFDAFFHGFGVGRTVYTITRRAPLASNPGRGQTYIFKTELDIFGIQPTTQGAQTSAQVREALGPLATLLPDDF